MNLKTTIATIAFVAISSIAHSDETISGTLTVEGNLRVLPGYESLYLGSSHSGATDHRNYFAPMKSDGSGFDWNREFGYNNYYKAWYFESSIGVGLQSPNARLHVANGSVTSNHDTYATMILENSNARQQILASDSGSNGAALLLTNNNKTWSLCQKTLSGGDNRLDFGYTYANGVIDNVGSQSVAMSLLKEGNIGIGVTDTEGYKLAVKGSIKAEEIVVESTWSDFVFQEGYRLRPLREVESHIESHGHLPDVPSAAAIESKGLSIGETQKIMMQKIEELTLYVIAQQKEIDELKTQLSQQNARYNSE